MAELLNENPFTRGRLFYHSSPNLKEHVFDDNYANMLTRAVALPSKHEWLKAGKRKLSAQYVFPLPHIFCNNLIF